MKKKIFPRRFPLSIFQDKTLRVNKPAMKKFPKKSVLLCLLKRAESQITKYKNQNTKYTLKVRDWFMSRGAKEKETHYGGL